MIRNQITDTIEYIEPSGIHSNICCAGLVFSSSPKIVIDLNLSNGDTESVLQEIQPERAYTTHFHLDHSRFWQEIKKYCTADFYIPKGEEAFLSDVGVFLENVPAKYRKDAVWNLFLEISGYTAIEHYKIFDGFHRFKTGATTVECIVTPGHSPFHTSFYLPVERILFAGDLGLNNRFGPWYGWENCDIEQYIESLLRLKSLQTDVLLTSHEGIVHSDIDLVLDNCLSHFFLREQAIREQLEAGKSNQEITAAGIYFTNKERVKEPMRKIITVWDATMLDHHLEILRGSSLEERFPNLAKRLLNYRK